MSLRDKVQDEINKLYRLCNKSDLTFHFDYNTSPATMTIKPEVTDDGQEKLFETNDGKRKTASDAKIEIVFEDGDVVIQTSSAFVIDDAIMSKVKSSAKKIFTLFTWLFFDDTKKLPDMGSVVDDSLFVPDEAEFEGEEDEDVEVTEEAQELEEADFEEELEDLDDEVPPSDGETPDTEDDENEE